MTKRGLSYTGILLAGLVLGVLLFFNGAKISLQDEPWHHYTLSDPQATPCGPPDGLYLPPDTNDAFYEVSVTLTNDGLFPIHDASFVPGYFSASDSILDLTWLFSDGSFINNPLYLNAFSSALPPGESVRCTTILTAPKDLASCTLYYDPYNIYETENGKAALDIPLL